MDKLLFPKYFIKNFCSCLGRLRQCQVIKQLIFEIFLKTLLGNQFYMIFNDFIFFYISYGSPPRRAAGPTSGLVRPPSWTTTYIYIQTASGRAAFACRSAGPCLKQLKNLPKRTSDRAPSFVVRNASRRRHTDVRAHSKERAR